MVNLEEAKKIFLNTRETYRYKLDDVERLVELKKIISRYNGYSMHHYTNSDICLQAVDSHLIRVCEYGYPGYEYEKEDVIKLAELGFFIVDGYIAMFSPKDE